MSRRIPQGKLGAGIQRIGDLVDSGERPRPNPLLRGEGTAESGGNPGTRLKDEDRKKWSGASGEAPGVVASWRPRALALVGSA